MTWYTTSYKDQPCCHLSGSVFQKYQSNCALMTFFAGNKWIHRQRGFFFVQSTSLFIQLRRGNHSLHIITTSHRYSCFCSNMKTEAHLHHRMVGRDLRNYLDQSICSRRWNRLWQSQQPNLSRPANTLMVMLHCTSLSAAELNPIKCCGRAEHQVNFSEIWAEIQSL